MQFIIDEYTLEYIEEEDKYFISFKDSVGKDCKIEINKTIFDEYIKSGKAYKKIKNETQRHIDLKLQTEESLYINALKKPKSLEEDVLHNITIDKLQKAEKELTEIQMRRLEKHFIEGITIRELATMENVRKNQIEKSIQLGLKKIFEI